MNLLAYSPPGRRSARGIDTDVLKELLGVEFSLYKSVITALTTETVCYTIARMVYLSEGAEQITMYDLMVIFHGGIPLGNTTEFDWNKGDYLYDRCYAGLREKEIKIEKDLKQQMMNMYILDLLNPAPTDPPGEETREQAQLAAFDNF